MRLAFALVALSAAASAQAPDELDALAGQGAWAELLEKAEKTAPTARTDAWRELVTRAAAAVVKGAAPGKEAFEAATRADTLAERFTFLAGRPAFLAARDEAVLLGARRCLELDDSCWKRLGAFELTLTPAGSLALGKALKRRFVAWRFVPLFARAVSVVGAPTCRDADVLAATLAGLELPDDAAPAVSARQIAFEWCWAAMQPALVNSQAGASSYRLQNTCASLRARKALTELQADLCADEGR